MKAKLMAAGAILGVAALFTLVVKLGNLLQRVVGRLSVWALWLLALAAGGWVLFHGRGSSEEEEAGSNQPVE